MFNKPDTTAGQHYLWRTCNAPLHLRFRYVPVYLCSGEWARYTQVRRHGQLT